MAGTRNTAVFARLLFDVMIPAEVAEAIRTNGYDVREARTLAAAIQSKKVASEEVVDAHLRRIEAVNPALNAVVQLTRTT